MNRTRSKGLVFACILVVCLAACATSPLGKAYDILATREVIYDTGLTYAGDEYRAGRISEEQKDQIVKYASRFKLGWETAKAAAITYKKALRARGENADVSTEQIALKTAVDAASAAQKLLLEYMALLSKGG